MGHKTQPLLAPVFSLATCGCGLCTAPLWLKMENPISYFPACSRSFPFSDEES